MAETVIQLPRLYPRQREVFFTPARISVCEASTKAGKSVGALAWLMDYGMRVAPGTTLLWCAPVYPQAKVMFQRVERWMTKADPRKTSGWDSNKTDLWVALPGGSRIVFKGSDNADTIYGSDYSAAVVDEASRCREEAWHAVRSTLTSTRGPVRVIGNVKGRKNWAYRLGRMAEAGEPNMAFFRLTAYDAVKAGVIDAEEVEEAKRTLPEAVFRELYLAEPSEDGSNPFGAKAIRECIGGMSDGRPEWWGVDLAKSVDWTVAIGLDEAGRVCRFERWQSDWRQTKERLVDLLGSTPALVDATGVGDPIVEDLQRDCPGVEGFKFTSTSKQQLMEGLASAIQRGLVGYPDGVIVAELESFEFEHTRTGVRYTAPDGLHDDCVCALALAVQAANIGQRNPFSFRLI